MAERMTSTNCRVFCRRCRPNDYGSTADLSSSITRDVMLSVSLSHLPPRAFRLFTSKFCEILTITVVQHDAYSVPQVTVETNTVKQVGGLFRWRC